MKKIINGKAYNTKTAQLIASDSYSHPGDFNYWDEELYKTKKGQYFIYGEGGPMTKYSQSIGNNTTSGGHGLFLVNPEEAREWLERHGTSEEYEAEFEVEEG